VHVRAASKVPCSRRTGAGDALSRPSDPSLPPWQGSRHSVGSRWHWDSRLHRADTSFRTDPSLDKGFEDSLHLPEPAKDANASSCGGFLETVVPAQGITVLFKPGRGADRLLLRMPLALEGGPLLSGPELLWMREAAGPPAAGPSLHPKENAMLSSVGIYRLINKNIVRSATR